MKDEYKEMVCRVRFIDGVPAKTYLSDVEIVRCKDCKYHLYERDIPYCSNIDYGYGWNDEDYCSKGERRESCD